MDLFLAGIGDERKNTVVELSDFNGLYSYEYNKDNFNLKKVNGKIFIDSGAYTAWTKGIKINVDEYIEWINKRSDFIYLYGQVDTIPGTINGGHTVKEVKEASERTWENYLYMKPKMKNPDGLLYTYHVGEPIECLERALCYVDNGKLIPYIALGGMVGKSRPARKNFLTMVFNKIKESPNPNVKIHAFGMTDKELLEQFPITSVDSTSWIMVAATGGIITDFGVFLVSPKRLNSFNYYGTLSGGGLIEFKKAAEEFGFTLDELESSRDKRVIHNARYMNDRISKIKYVNNKVIKKSLF